MAARSSSSLSRSSEEEEEIFQTSNTEIHQQEEEKEQKEENMPKIPSISSTRAATLTSNLKSINERIIKSSKSSSLIRPGKTTRLLAVSKLKPVQDILSLYSTEKHLHFGENYFQELKEKSELLSQTKIKWSFIGQLQTNKCLQLSKNITRLWSVQGVDSQKKAEKLEKGRSERNNNQKNNDIDDDDDKRLKIFIQINTSGEETKGGIKPPSNQNIECLNLCKFILNSCPNLKLQGLMTIGSIARSKSTTSGDEGNEDFICLRESRDFIAKQLGMEKFDLELSMGMSEDFENAIAQGSDEVRIGSTIFGERPPKKEASIT